MKKRKNVYRTRRWHRPPHKGQRGRGRKCVSRGLGKNIR